MISFHFIEVFSTVLNTGDKHNKDDVIPPNSNTFPDWRRTCHVPLVKTQQQLELWTRT